MGYERKYKLSLQVPNISGERRAKLQCEVVNGVWSVDRLTVYGVEAKWYDHEDDMRALSAAWPDVVFKLQGVAQDFDGVPTQESFFVKYFVGGKMQHETAQITFAPLDESKLS